MAQAVRETTLPGLPLYRRGKVRELYAVGDGLLLMVASDRISAFDVVMDQLVPDKGRILTALSRFWFARTASVVPNHLVTTNVDDFPEAARAHRSVVAGRSMLVRHAERIDVECVVRGYLAGSGWAEYRADGTLAEETLPPGLEESARLPEPRFTPAIKAESGHDENISRATLRDMVGAETAHLLESASLRLYAAAEEHLHARGLILADTKFEFGFHDGALLLIDEVLTPDSSRYWPTHGYRPGRPQPSFDKQYLRDYLEGTEWNKQPPPPPLPAEVVDATAARYREALERVTGTPLEDLPR
ncbi:MAG: phosphoribosylaminoimidazolesuccinocarboxamide synthase [Chloroflexi bacterium]|nr:phosphoribosylaminoimidazolesuccinocarboxamide synthase [Chloroflexota bacterium]